MPALDSERGGRAPHMPLSPEIRALLRVTAPEERAGVKALAERARAEFETAVEALSPVERGWLADTPVERALTASRRRGAGADHSRFPRAFVQIATQVEARGGPEWTAAYARLLLLAQLAALPLACPEHRLPELAWAGIEDSLRLLLEAVPSIATASLGERGFVNDLRAAQLQWLPSDGQVVTSVRVHPWYLAREGGIGGRAELARYLGAGTIRTLTVIEGHEWRGYREHRPNWRTGMARMAAVAAVNPVIAGEIPRNWLNDPALRNVSPRLAAKADEIIAAGAHRFATAMTPVTTSRALQTSETRRRLYAEGKYVPRVFGTFFKRSAWLRWARERWESGEV